jgi:hypothetical protein
LQLKQLTRANSHGNGLLIHIQQRRCQFLQHFEFAGIDVVLRIQRAKGLVTKT